MEYRITARSLTTDNVVSFLFYTSKTEEEVYEYMSSCHFEILSLEGQEETPISLPDLYDGGLLVDNLEEEEDEFTRILKEGGVADLFGEEE